MRHVGLVKMFVAGVTSCLAILPTPASSEPAAESQEHLERDLTGAQNPIFQIGQLKPQGPSIRGGGPQRIGMHNVLFRIAAGDAAHGCR
jgi:hypothetical protein